jgi:hypothetical protein
MLGRGRVWCTGIVIFEKVFASEETFVKTMAEEYAHAIQGARVPGLLGEAGVDRTLAKAAEQAAMQFAEQAWQAFLRGITIKF